MVQSESMAVFEGLLIVAGLLFVFTGTAVLLFKDLLANLGARIMLQLQKPFKVGDMIHFKGITGRVEAIGLLRTCLNTLDDMALTIPNAGLAQGSISNLSNQAPRAADLIYGIASKEDIESTMDIIDEVLSKEKRILCKPTLGMSVNNDTEDCVFVTARIWIGARDFWPVVIATNNQVKRQFAAEEIPVTYP